MSIMLGGGKVFSATKFWGPMFQELLLLDIKFHSISGSNLSEFQLSILFGISGAIFHRVWS